MRFRIVWNFRVRWRTDSGHELAGGCIRVKTCDTGSQKFVPGWPKSGRKNRAVIQTLCHADPGSAHRPQGICGYSEIFAGGVAYATVTPDAGGEHLYQEQAATTFRRSVRIKLVAGRHMCGTLANAQPARLPILQNFTADYPPGRDDVNPVSTPGAECRRSTPRAGHRQHP